MSALGGAKSGMTLIETLVSVIILNIALCTVLGAFVMGKMSVSRVKHKMEAVNILQKALEGLKNTPYSNIVSGGPTPIIMETNLTANQTVTVIDNNGYKEVRVNLSWTETGWGQAGNAAGETFVTYISAWSKYLNA